MAISLGLDIDAQAIKMVVLSGNEKGAKIKNFIVEKLDAKGGPNSDLVAVVQRLFEQHSLPTGNVIMSVRAIDCLLRDITVPFLEKKQIDQTIKFQAEQTFHSQSIDDFVVQYNKYMEQDGKSKLFVAGAEKSLIEQRLGLMAEVGVDPAAIDLDVSALANTYQAAGLTEDRKLVVVVDIEANHMRLAVIEDGKLRTARSIRKRFGDRKKKKQDEGESARLPVVILDEDEDIDDEESFNLEDSNITAVERDSYLNGLFREIDRTVAMSRSEESVDFIILTGASCALPGIEEMFEEHFEVEVRKIDLGKAFPGGRIAGGNVSLQGSVALGLALKGIGVDFSAMDFRREEYAYQGRFEKLKKGLACTLCLAFVMCFLFAFGLKQEWQVKKQRLAGVKLLQQHLYTVLFPDFQSDEVGRDYKPPISKRGWMASVQEEQQRLSNIYGGTLAKKAIKESAINVLREFCLRKRDCKVPIEVTTANITQKQTRIHCVSPRVGADIELRRTLQESKMFEARSERNTEKEGVFEFDIVLELIEQKEDEES